MPGHSPLFSVIIPAHNREKLVGAALCSVVAQTDGDWECIVVDDGSTDGTRVSVQMIHGILKGVAEKEKTKAPDIRVIRQANGGPGAARNAGAAQARGRYLAFLDSDDVWLPWALETYRNALEQADWPEYLAATIRTFSDEKEPAGWRREAPRVLRHRDAIEACDRGVAAGGPMTVVAADAFRRVGGFLEDRLNAEDHDLTLRLGECRGFVSVAAPVTVGYRRHGVQETSSHAKAVGGILRMVSREKAGAYPGGGARAGERRRILAAHARPVCLAALRAGDISSAWRIYRETFLWQMRAGRVKFIVGLPLLLFHRSCTLSA